MQNVKFHSIEEFFDFLPEDELKLTLYLREIVFRCIPGIQESLKYNVPYYKRHKNICFIWPSSILWGNKKSYEGVRFGFTQGHLLTDTELYLEKGDRKYVYWKDFQRTNEVDVAKLEALLFEASFVDDDLGDNRAG